MPVSCLSFTFNERRTKTKQNHDSNVLLHEKSRDAEKVNLRGEKHNRGGGRWQSLEATGRPGRGRHAGPAWAAVTFGGTSPAAALLARQQVLLPGLQQQERLPSLRRAGGPWPLHQGPCPSSAAWWGQTGPLRPQLVSGSAAGWGGPELSLCHSQSARMSLQESQTATDAGEAKDTRGCPSPTATCRQGHPTGPQGWALEHTGTEAGAVCWQEALESSLWPVDTTVRATEALPQRGALEVRSPAQGNRTHLREHSASQRPRPQRDTAEDRPGRRAMGCLQRSREGTCATAAVRLGPRTSCKAHALSPGDRL